MVALLAISDDPTTRLQLPWTPTDGASSCAGGGVALRVRVDLDRVLAACAAPAWR
jgi:hypothetical protein